MMVDAAGFGAPVDPMDVRMSSMLGGVPLTGPVLTASGCAAAGKELSQFFDLRMLGAIVTKSIMVESRSGRATPRMAETPSGMLNSIGLQGPGIDEFIAKDLAWLAANGIRTIVSIAGTHVEDYVRLARRLMLEDAVAGLEVNISCPNVESRGEVFACDPRSAAAVIGAVRSEVPSGIPVIAKLSPDVTDLVSIAGSVLDAGADALALINTLLGVVINPDTLRPALGGITGGLSGPAIRPVAVRAVYQVRAAFPDVSILGMGGIRTGADAMEFLAAGASAISVGTAIFNDPSAPARVHRELRELLAAKGIGDIRDVIGIAHTPLPTRTSIAHSDGDAETRAALNARSQPSVIEAATVDQIVIRSERIAPAVQGVEIIEDISVEFDWIRSRTNAAESAAETTAEVES